MYYILLPIAWLVWHVGFRIRVVGRENLIRDRGFILAPNHISCLDPVFVIVTRFFGKQMRIFAKKELYEKNLFVTWFVTMAGGVAVRGTKGEMDAVNRTVDECKTGRGLLIFPEGTRSKDGEIGLIKSGAFVVASSAGVDLIPCRIIYGTKDGRLRPFCRVRVCYGKPIPAEELALGEKRDMKKLKAEKQRLAQAWQTLYEQNKF